MDRDFLLLTHISQNENVSQRQLAKLLDVSLGTVNGIIQQMLQNGCLTLDTSNHKQVKYFLTPEGYKIKALKNYDWIVKSYHTISQTKLHIRNHIEKQIAQGIDLFYLFGVKDEIYRLIKMCLIELKREHQIDFRHITNLDTLDQVGAFCVLYWNNEFPVENHMNCIHILN